MKNTPLFRMSYLCYFLGGCNILLVSVVIYYEWRKRVGEKRPTAYFRKSLKCDIVDLTFTWGVGYNKNDSSFTTSNRRTHSSHQKIKT